MAMTEEELLLQANILINKLSDNPNMVFKTSKILNKGLNPDYYSGNDTKVVNILNSLFEKNQQVDIIANNVANKVNELVGDSSSTLGAANWEKLQGLMEQPTIIEGLNDLFEGKFIDKILNINVADKGKVLSIDEDAEGNLILKAIDAIAGGTGSTNVSVENIEYTNNNVADITNVKEALDYLVDKIVNGDFGDGEWGGGIQMGEITWDMIDDRPEFVADKLEINSEQLVLKDGETILSTVPLMTNQDIDELIQGLE